MADNRRGRGLKLNNPSIKKASPATSTRKFGVGTSGFSFFQDIVNRIQPLEMRWPYSIKTFEAMKNDDAIATVLRLNYALVESAFSNKRITYNKKSTKSKRAAKFLEYGINNMKSMSFLDSIRAMATFKEKGFSVIEKIYPNIKSGEYSGMSGLDLGFRPQLSLDTSIPFEIDSGGNRIISARQNTSYFANKTTFGSFIPTDQSALGYKRIMRGRFVLIGEGCNESTPFGNPILRACYKPWKEKLMLEDLEINGASKDLAGIIEIAIPSDILEKAAKDPESFEAQIVGEMIEDARAVHAGRQSSFVRPSDVQSGSNSIPDYSFRLLGLEGGGKQFNTSEMIKERRKAIFDVFGAGYVSSQDGGSVSYNSAEVKSSTHMDFIKSDIRIIEDGYNRDIIPQWLNVINDMKLSYEDMPKIVAGEIHPISLEELSKYGQRLTAVNQLPTVPEVTQVFVDRLGANYTIPEDLDPEGVSALSGGDSKPTSRSGDGMESGLNNGVGGSTSSGSDRSVSNMENKSKSKLTGLKLTENGKVINSYGDIMDIEDLPEDIRNTFTE